MPSDWEQMAAALGGAPTDADNLIQPTPQLANNDIMAKALMQYGQQKAGALTDLASVPGLVAQGKMDPNQPEWAWDTAKTLAGVGMTAPETGAAGAFGGVLNWNKYPNVTRGLAKLAKKGDVPPEPPLDYNYPIQAEPLHQQLSKEEFTAAAKQANDKFVEMQKTGEMGALLKEFIRNNPDVVGPSMPLKPKNMNPEHGIEVFNEKKLHQGIPSNVPWKPSQRALEAGYNISVAHGTRTPHVFDEFKLPEELNAVSEIGIHAGSPKATTHFTGSSIGGQYDASPRVYPLVMKAQNPLDLPDIGNWSSGKMYDALSRYHGSKFTKEELDKAYDSGDIKAFRDLIKSKGYDSIKYTNAQEDPGHTSYIALDPKQLRAPWAAFKDLNSRNLLAGLTGGGVMAPVVTKQIVDTLTKTDEKK
jgi:hypothetical protein